MAFSELGLTEEEFFSMPPFRTYLMQMHANRMIERSWEQTREVAVMVHNMTPGAKRHLRASQFVKLSFDKNVEFPEWTKEEAEEIIRKWPDIKKN